MSAREKIIEAIDGFNWDTYVDDDERQWVSDLANRICAAIDDEPFHTIDVTETGWTLKHPLDCRDDLFNCPTNQLAEQLDRPPAPPGRYRVDLVEGLLAIGESVPVGSSGSSSGGTR